MANIRNLLQEHQFLVPSYSHYGGHTGYQNYGILGCKIKNKLLEFWRKTFLHNTGIFEIECPSIMPYAILKASGHVDRFTDYVVYDGEGICHRADHLVRDYYREHGIAGNVETLTREELEEAINKYAIIRGVHNETTDTYAPVTVTTKNLMFSVPSHVADTVDYVRPELAQGIFVEFKQCQQYLKRELPFGLAQIGKSYRNEISPKQFTRMREFTQAEIEYFTDPTDKTHPKFSEITDITVPILTAHAQLAGDTESLMVSLGSAVESGFIRHQTMAVFIARIYQFAVAIGLRPDLIRFREHLPHEMAHYASECWDLEAFVDGDWLECVGCADRGDYDLSAHDRVSTNPAWCKSMKMRRNLTEPIVVNKLSVMVHKKIVAKQFGCVTPVILDHFNALTPGEIAKLKDTDSNVIVSGWDEEYIVTRDMFEIVEKKERITFEEFYPHVIEPSFGIDRLMYVLLNHTIWVREADDKRLVMSLPKHLVPYDVAIFQLHNKPDMIACAGNIQRMLSDVGFDCWMDDSSTSIGKRYCRVDEIGIRYVITVDPGSLKDGCVTVRERDSMLQNRICITNLISYLHAPNESME